MNRRTRGKTMNRRELQRAAGTYNRQWRGLLVTVASSMACVAPDPRFIATGNESSVRGSETDHGSTEGTAASTTGDTAEPSSEPSSEEARLTETHDSIADGETSTSGRGEELTTGEAVASSGDELDHSGETPATEDGTTGEFTEASTDSDASESEADSTTTGGGGTDSEEDSSTDATSSTELSTTDSDATSESTEASTDDATDDTTTDESTGGITEVKQPIRLRNSSSFQPTGVGQAIALSFDHARMVAAGARSDGADLRVVQLRDGLFYEIDRVLDPGSSWNSMNTMIWFRNAADIGPRGEDATTHWLQYGGENAGIPLGRAAEIFDYYDDFTSARYTAVSHENASDEVADGRLTLTANATAGNQSRVRIHFREFQIQYPGIVLETRFRILDPNLPFECGSFGLATLEDSGEERARASIYAFNGGYTHGSWNGTTSVYDEPTTSPALDGDWHILSMYWLSDAVTLHIDGQQVLVDNTNPSWSTPDHGPTQARLELAVGGNACPQFHATSLEFDWLRVRRAGTTLPAADLP